MDNKLLVEEIFAQKKNNLFTATKNNPLCLHSSK
jgi:hypothetical protein